MISNSQYRPYVGLALGGGVVRGFAHLGVISALQEHHIPIDCVAGSSVGSIVGAIICAGIPAEQALEHAAELNWLKLARPIWPSQGFLSFQKLEEWIIEYLGNRTFDDLTISLCVATTDLLTGEKVLLTSGNLARAVHASCAIPGIVSPAEVNGRLLGDGSLLDAIPVSGARLLGADYVIGVNILTPTQREGWGALGFLIDGLEITIEKAGGGYYSADCLINPNLAGATYLRFSKIYDLFERGRTATLANISRIKDDLATLSADYIDDSRRQVVST